MKHSLFNLSRLPALRNRITRASHAKNVQKKSWLKSKLGDRYSEIGRDKRYSPTTLKRSSTKDSQRQIKEPEFKLKDFLVSSDASSPLPIIPGDITETLKLRSLRIKDSKKDEVVKSGIRMQKTVVKKEVERILSIKNDTVPKIIKKSGTFGNVTTTTSNGPYYAFNLEPDQLDLLLKKTSLAAAKKSNRDENSNDKAQAECLRRIISLENGSGVSFKKFNRQRIIELLGSEPFDTGSSQVQAGMFTLRIQRFKEHLEKNPKDNSMKRQLDLFTSKRVKILRHLRKKVINYLIYFLEFTTVC